MNELQENVFQDESLLCLSERNQEEMRKSLVGMKTALSERCSINRTTLGFSNALELWRNLPLILVQLASSGTVISNHCGLVHGYVAPQAGGNTSKYGCARQ